jgi:hypothetical protein
MPALSRAQAEEIVAMLQAKTLKVGLFLNQATEVSGVGYTRQPITLANAQYIAGTGVRTANQGDVSFGLSGAGWAEPPNKIAWIKVFDTADWHVVWGGELPSTMQMSLIEGQPYEIKAGMLALILYTYD